MTDSPELEGIRPERTLALMRERKLGSIGSPTSTGMPRKLGLVIEGGGMRGVISCAMADALYQLGFGQTFDFATGNSAGAMNAAYFVSGQITMGTSVYYQNLVGDRFVRISRFPNIMDLDYLFNGWILGEKPLNLDLLSKSKTELCICTTKMSDGTPRYFGNRGPELRSVIPALKASCSTPLFTRNVESIDGELYGDGLINDAIPLDRALDAGCTDLVLLLTRTSGYKKSIGFTERLLGWLQTRHLSNAYRAMFLTQGTRYNALLDRISAGQVSCESLLVLRPTQEGMIQNGEARPDRVRHAARCGLSVVARTFKSSPDKLRLYDEVAIGS